MSTARFDRFSYAYPGSIDLALDRVTLALDGGVTALTGASGSGKSSLLRVLNGLVPHFHGGTVRGAATVCGLDVLTTPTRRLAQHVGFLFQDPELQAVYATVERDVAFGLENLGVPCTAMRARVDDALERTGIATLRHRAIATLSGGERQRVALAGVIALAPRLLVLDEPLSQLDGAGAESLMATVAALAAGDTAVLIAEHRLEHVLPRTNHVLTIEQGTVTARDAGGREGWVPGIVTEPRRSVLGAQVEASVSGGAAEPLRPRGPGGPSFESVSDSAAHWALRNVSAGFARAPVLENVELSQDGGVVVLTGANGSGKTTLLRTLAGLLPPLAGRVERAPGRVAYLPQNPTSLLHRPTVRDEVAWTLRRDAAHGQHDVDATLDRFRLGHVAGRYPRDLSTGERQRAALAAVLVGSASLALLDEPTRGMDAAARHALEEAITELRDAGGAVVIATHDQQLAAAVADRIVRIDGGAVREVETAQPLLT